MIRPSLCGVVFIVVVPVLAGRIPAATFLPLASGTTEHAVVNRMSADSSILVGSVTNQDVGDFVPAVFRLDGSVEIVELNPGVAFDCTPDGSRIVGQRFPADFLPFLYPCMWVGPAHDVVQFAIPEDPFSFFGYCGGISDDGATAALFRYGQSEATAFRGFMDGSVQPLEASDDHYAYAASPDGTLIAGRHVGASHGTFATLWNASTGEATDLVDPSGVLDYGDPSAFSPDGQFIVGFAAYSGASAVGAYRASTGGAVHLIHAPAFSARASNASDGARVVVGIDDDAVEAFVWDSSHGVRFLADVLTEQGVDMTGWHLTDALDVSADGTRICGNASLNGAPTVPYLATIAPPPCEGDADANGSVGLSDIARIILNWDAIGVAGGRGDIDADGRVGLGDAALVIQHFSEVCPGG